MTFEAVLIPDIYNSGCMHKGLRWKQVCGIWELSTIHSYIYSDIPETQTYVAQKHASLQKNSSNSRKNHEVKNSRS